MNDCVENESTVRPEGKWFDRTCWTVILKAREAGEAGADEALEQLVRNYWPPIYCFIRRQGYRRHDAEDLTQGFYQHFLGKKLLNRVTERRDKFRNYLLTCLKYYLSDERDRARALKRGGGRSFIALDALEAEERAALEPSHRESADQIYDRRWAQALFNTAKNKLRWEYERRGQLALFEQLKELQPGQHGERSHAAIAALLGMTVQAVKNAAHSFRRRYAEALRAEVAQTVQDPQQTLEELNHLIRMFAR